MFSKEGGEIESEGEGRRFFHRWVSRTVQKGGPFDVERKVAMKGCEERGPLIEKVRKPGKLTLGGQKTARTEK